MFKRPNNSQTFFDGLYSTAVTAAFFNWSSRRKLVRAFLVVLLLMNFRTFEYFPNFRPVQELWYAFTLGSFVVFYPLLKIALDWRFTRVELYMLLILPVLLLLPAITANQVFGQPLFYGLFPQRGSLPILWWILLINAWKLGWVDASDMKAALIFSVWGTFTLFNLMRLLLHPANYTVPGFTVGTGGDAAFTLSALFAVFGIFYYVFRAIRERRSFYYLFGVVNLISAVGASGRSLSVSIILILALFLIIWRGFARSLPAIGGFLAILAVSLSISYAVKPAATSERVQKYADAFRVASGASEVQDVSANARIYESQTAKPYVLAHPITGVGSVSLQWQGGLVAALGQYFVPGDIGLIGIAFTYGGFGLLLFAAQYLFTSRFVNGSGPVSSTPLIDATRGFILFTAIYSAVTGLFVFNIEVSTFFIILLTLLTSSARVPQFSESPRGPRAHLTETVPAGG